jgi:hypothetical protein
MVKKRNLHYVSRDWDLSTVSGRGNRNRPTPPSERYHSDRYVNLRAAIEMFGASNVRGWNGREADSRFLISPPRPPWEIFFRRKMLPKLLIFNPAHKPIYVEESEAWEWWNKIKPRLDKEYRAELNALMRWIEARGRFRHLLADGKVRALLHTEAGTIHNIPPREWRSSAGAGMEVTGLASVEITKMGSTTTYEGMVVLNRASLKTFLASREAAPSLNIDEELHPYVAFMLKAINSLPFDSTGRLSKGIIMIWLKQNWPPSLGRDSDLKVKTMATFLRRPEDEKGGNHPRRTSRRRTGGRKNPERV